MLIRSPSVKAGEGALLGKDSTVLDTLVTLVLMICVQQHLMGLRPS